MVLRTSLPQCKISLHNFHPPSVVDDDEDNGNESDDEDGHNDGSSRRGGGVGGGGGQRSQLDHPVYQLESAVDPKSEGYVEGKGVRSCPLIIS